MLHAQSDAVMAGVPREQGGGFTWQQWFVDGDPFSPHDDGEPTGAAHLLRHGVDIGQVSASGREGDAELGPSGGVAGRRRDRVWRRACGCYDALCRFRKRNPKLTNEDLSKLTRIARY